jgi:hypothetical protein
MRLCVIGDSHSLFCFCETAEASIFWLGPVLMHRIARDGLRSVLPRRCKLARFDALVLVFGEIDCRVHVTSIAKRDGKPVAAVVEDLAARFVSAIADIQREFAKPIAICCVIPPMSTLALEPGETQEEARRSQVGIRRLMNDRLRTFAAGRDIRFIDFYDDYAAETGELLPGMSDGVVHIGRGKTKPIVDATAATLGVPLTYRPIDRDIFLIPVGYYWRRRRQLLDVWFKRQLKHLTGRA